MAGRVLLRGGCVLTLGTRTANYTEADVLIDGDRIAEVGPRLRARDAEVIDATDTIVMPGFVDAHRHAWTSLLRNRDIEGFEAATPAPDLQPEDVYAATLISLLTAAGTGTTTVVDWADFPSGAAYMEASLQAHADSGLRTVLVSDGPVGDGGTLPATTTLAAACPTPAAAALDEVASSCAGARGFGQRIHAHAGTTPATAGAVAEMGRRGLLGRDVTLVHCTHLDDSDLDAVSSSDAAVVLTPASEMATGRGAPPMQRLIDRGIRPGLGVDAERIAPGDMFAPMRTAISIQHATVFDLKLVGKGGVPKLLTTREVIRYATIDAARAVGLESTTGSLEAGKRADVIVLRTDRPNIFPVNDPIGAVVWGMDTSNLVWVFVAGRALMRHGSLEGDVERARKLASEAQQRVASSGVVAAGRGEST